MADQKISAMPSALTLDGTELVPLVQSGVNVKATIADLSTYITTYDRAYIAVQSNVTQTSSTTVPTAFQFEITDESDGITIGGGNTRFIVPNTGVYNFQFSVQFQNLNQQPQDALVWLRKNGSDVTGSNSFFGMLARKSAGVPSYVIGSLNYFISLNATEYVQLYWLVSNTEVTSPYFPASASPPYPSTPSIIATMNQVA